MDLLRRIQDFRPVRAGIGLMLALALVLAYKGIGHGRVAAADAPATQSQPQQSVGQLVGMEAIDQRLGDKSPTGRGIVVGHVEAEDAGAYLPLITPERYPGVKFVKRSGEGNGKISSHASATATVIYGPKGLAPGVSEVDLFTVNDWLTTGCLNVDRLSDPDPGKVRVFNHSWISDGGPGFPILKRADDLIERRNVLMVVGTNNGSNKAVPAVLASGYNVISVGEWDGNSSGGYTREEGTGRCKPEIVAPGSRTSFATPVVTAAVARLLEAADAMPSAAAAHKPAVIKALLLAGADKPASWHTAPGKPLDEHLGAGRLRFDHSYDALIAGPIPPGKTAVNSGWDYHVIKPKGSATYLLQLDHPASVSIILTWNRRVNGQAVIDFIMHKPRWSEHPRLADLDLALHADTAAAGPEDATSASTIDNIEHIYVRQLPPGRYRINVTRKDDLDEDWDYAVAWCVGSPVQ